MSHDIKMPFIDTTEEVCMGTTGKEDKEFPGWRRYRIEYGGFNEYCQMEGTIYLPRHGDPDAIVNLIKGMWATEQQTKYNNDWMYGR